MGKVLLFLADGFEEIEALAVVDLLRRADIDVQTVSIGSTKRAVGRSRIAVEADVLFSKADREDAEMLILPGGMPGTRYLGGHEGLRDLLLARYADGAYVAAICAAPTVLAMHGLLKGKTATCYPGLEDKLLDGGASVRTDSEVIRDGRVITSRGAGTAIPFGFALIEALRDRETAEAVRKGIVYGAES